MWGQFVGGALVGVAVLLCLLAGLERLFGGRGSGCLLAVGVILGFLALFTLIATAP